MAPEKTLNWIPGGAAAGATSASRDGGPPVEIAQQRGPYFQNAGQHGLAPNAGGFHPQHMGFAQERMQRMAMHAPADFHSQYNAQMGLPQQQRPAGPGQAGSHPRLFPGAEEAYQQSLYGGTFASSAGDPSGAQSSASSAMTGSSHRLGQLPGFPSPQARAGSAVSDYGNMGVMGRSMHDMAGYAPAFHAYQLHEGAQGGLPAQQMHRDVNQSGGVQPSPFGQVIGGSLPSHSSQSSFPLRTEFMRRLQSVGQRHQIPMRELMSIVDDVFSTVLDTVIGRPDEEEGDEADTPGKDSVSEKDGKKNASGKKKSGPCAVTIRNFGKFELKQRKSRNIVHIKTGETVVLPEQFALTFRPSPSVKAALKSARVDGSKLKGAKGGAKRARKGAPASVKSDDVDEEDEFEDDDDSASVNTGRSSDVNDKEAASEEEDGSRKRTRIS